jgi:hypothetical protein
MLSKMILSDDGCDPVEFRYGAALHVDEASGQEVVAVLVIQDFKGPSLFSHDRLRNKAFSEVLRSQVKDVPSDKVRLYLLALAGTTPVRGFQFQIKEYSNETGRINSEFESRVELKQAELCKLLARVSTN